jgi:uncharacterized protein (TIGR02680 family)
VTSHATRDLPRPANVRWQPLRLGLVELYHYDYEEFWFRDGHLLLRGNNGTGKSKVLSLTLPFLLDARLEPSRVEPDGDRNKRMDWNLLMGHLPQRTGYTWMELGRIGDDEVPVYLTLGCGLKAMSGRRRVDRWFFITEQRVGENLALISPEGAVPGRERLAEAIAGHGQLYENAGEYRHAVDERLFRLGEAGYRALVDTLIELRQPQLSKQPDESRLSKALTDALPALPASVLDDVSTALTQLKDDREALSELERRRAAVARFSDGYRAYASVQARREARVLRHAESRLDAARRALAAAREAHEAAAQQAQDHTARCEAFAIELAGARAELEERRADPIMREARRLAELERAAADRERDAARAETRCEAARERRDRERAERVRREAEHEAAIARLGKTAALATELAGAIGLARGHAEVITPITALVADRDAALDAPALDAVRSELDARIRTRHEQIGRVRELVAEHDAAIAAYGRAHDLAREARAAHDRAEQQAREADGGLQRCATEHCAAWRVWFEALEALAVPDAQDVLGTLEDWVETLEGSSPARQAAEQAARHAAAAIAAQRASLDARAASLGAEDGNLATEAARLDRGEDRVPPEPHTRAPGVREGRAGAPLWQLVDFRDAVGAPERGGIEAALEASGLLDAWVTPEGSVLDPDTHDTWLAPHGRAAHPLSTWLEPSPGAIPIEPAKIGAVLDAIACTPEPDAEAAAWISPTGRYRLGPRAGAWTKPAAEYVGFAARAEARTRRLAEITARRNALARALAEIADERADVDAREERVAAEAAAAPGDDALRAAHAELSVAERERRAALARLAELDARLQAVNERVAAARQRLREDAAALALPTDRAGLDGVDAALRSYDRATRELCHLAHATAGARTEHAHQRAREADAEATLARETTEAADCRRAAEEARRRHHVLRETMGAEIAELERLLRAAEARVDETEHAREQARAQLQAAELEATRHEERVKAHHERERERAVERASAIERLREFSRTGLLRVAVPSLEVPDPRDEWTVDGALRAARGAERALAEVSAEDGDWERVRDRIGRDYAELGTALSALGQRAEGEQTEFGLVVAIHDRGRSLAPDTIERELGDEIAQRRAVLTAREREVIENHLQAEIAVNLQRLMQQALRHVQTVNTELHKRPTTTGVRFRLLWEPRPETETGPTQGLAAARKCLLDRTADAWSPADRETVGAFLQSQIGVEAQAGEGESMRIQLERALDYRAWHRFRVERYQDGSWRRLSGPASSGERALGLTVPLFAAASSHYASSDYPHAPRLVLLDEAFAGIDDAARAHCMALVREFDLDFVMTSEREWGCYAELPGVSICHLVRREGVEAVHVSRWTWDGHTRSAGLEPERPFGETVRGSV